jgi:hypothetical protein
MFVEPSGFKVETTTTGVPRYKMEGSISRCMIEFYPIDVWYASRFLRLIPPMFRENRQVSRCSVKCYPRALNPGLLVLIMSSAEHSISLSATPPRRLPAAVRTFRWSCFATNRQRRSSPKYARSVENFGHGKEFRSGKTSRKRDDARLFGDFKDFANGCAHCSSCGKR